MINIVQMYLLIDQLLTCSLVTRTGESIGPGETTQFRGNIMTFFFYSQYVANVFDWLYCAG